MRLRRNQGGGESYLAFHDHRVVRIRKRLHDPVVLGVVIRLKRLKEILQNNGLGDVFLLGCVAFDDNKWWELGCDEGQ